MHPHTYRIRARALPALVTEIVSQQVDAAATYRANVIHAANGSHNLFDDMVGHEQIVAGVNHPEVRISQDPHFE